MKEKLSELADALNAAVASDTPRATMNAVANQLRVLAAAVPDDDGARSFAFQLAEAIESHQYGLRGFGDGSMTRGRDFTSRESRTITRALRAFGKSGVKKLPIPRYYHVPGGGQLWATALTTGVPPNMEGLYTVEQVQELL